jgi:AcrR family transcriptional regulator
MTASARDRIIQTAHDMFYERGFHAVGLAAILNEVNVTKTTFYNHFESKDQLVSEVLRWHDRWWQDTFRQILRERGGDRPRDQLLAIPCVLDHIFACEGFNGCFFVNVAVQFPARHDPAHEAARDHKRTMEDLIRELAGYASADDPAGMAQELSLVLEGAYVTRQVTDNPDTSAIARRLVKMIVDRHCPPSQAAS